jgi:putative ABC transport system ATP-binding protein
MSSVLPLSRSRTEPGLEGRGEQPAVRLNDVRFGYRRGHAVLDIKDLEVGRGERVFLYGPSGSGKTTLLGLLAGVLRADGGQVVVLGQDLGLLSGRRRDAFRAQHIGYVFQLFNLIPYLSVLDNITLPCRTSPARRQQLQGETMESAARRLAGELGITNLLAKKVTDLSVGQQQRVAAARALLGSPELVIADEPTSALDASRREAFLDLLFRCCESAAATLVFVSHDLGLSRLFHRSLSLPEINAIQNAE